MKEEILKKKKLILLVLILILAIIFVNSAIKFLFSGSFDSNMRQKSDYRISNFIKSGIEKYIKESNDINLSFGSDSKLDMNKVLLSLQKKIIYNGEEYGPYLDIGNNKPKADLFYPLDNIRHKGWEIKIFTKTLAVDVKPSATGNSITFIE